MSYIVRIKNNTNAPKTWGGKSFALSGNEGDTRTLSDGDLNAFAKDTVFFTAIGTGDAEIGNSLSFFSSTNGWAYLIGDIPPIIQQAAITDPQGKRARLKGCLYGTSVKNTTTNHDWLIPQMQYQGSDVSSIFDGIEYYAEDSTIGDNLIFQVVDKDGLGVLAGWYTQATFDAMGNLYVVEEFGCDWHIAPNSLEDIILYKAALIPGLYLRVKYVNTSTTDDVQFFMNIFRHLDL